MWQDRQSSITVSHRNKLTLDIQTRSWESIWTQKNMPKSPNLREFFGFYRITFGQHKIHMFFTGNRAKLCRKNPPKLTPWVFFSSLGFGGPFFFRHPKVSALKKPTWQFWLPWRIHGTGICPSCSNPFCKWCWNGFWVPRHLLTVYLEH